MCIVDIFLTLATFTLVVKRQRQPVLLTCLIKVSTETGIPL